VIFYDNDSPVIAKYMSLKEQYGADIRIDTEKRLLTAETAAAQVREAAEDEKVSQIISRT
jgi:hypothetical protein